MHSPFPVHRPEADDNITPWLAAQATT